ncbi:MAG: aminomethyl-transferring glycine dehydrogenase [Elusimicrobia bacterium]|nr:aminomethyl-transferring glycine dehydrogenase [Elusimicrobiota bacterium]
MEATEVRPRSSDTPAPPDFSRRHIGPDQAETHEMLSLLGFSKLDGFVDAVIPPAIRSRKPLNLPPALSESAALAKLAGLAAKNKLFKSWIGMGFNDCVTPPVIQRNVLENPGWYTAYTPYQAEIAQGRLEALLNFQLMVMDLAALDVANASLLDEATACAEAMTLSWNAAGLPRDKAFFISDGCHPQNIAVVQTRARALGIHTVVADESNADFAKGYFGVLVQYPMTDGRVADLGPLCEKARRNGALVTVAADILGLVLLKAPGEFGADIAVGSTQRFGLAMGFGGPAAAYMAVRDGLKRLMPGRIVAVSKDSSGQPALRLSLQTREQHIRREKATSNICTAQVLTAVLAAFYASYHGPEGLKRIAGRVHGLACRLAEGLKALGWRVPEEPFFDTVRVEGDPSTVGRAFDAALARRINLRRLSEGGLSIALDETTTEEDLVDLLEVFSDGKPVEGLAEAHVHSRIPAPLRRASSFLGAPAFTTHHSETEMMRFIKRLSARDLTLADAMIPLGSCTMKLNAVSLMMPITWAGFAKPHPFAPKDQVKGTLAMIKELETWLREITGFSAFSFQPNAGSQGEYAGLLVIRRFHERAGEARRRICLIPRSAHGTNPASAAMAGLIPVTVECAPEGDIDLADLKAKAQLHREDLACLMVTYPSTHGVFEEGIKEICRIVHAHGGLVYMDGANMNAMVGLCRPAELGADVGHLNLHKTFGMPHGGGGPGMGPIGVARKLAGLLPNDPLDPSGRPDAAGPVASAAYSSASILPISWAYIAQMGEAGLKAASETAILNANYVAKRLEGHYATLFKGRGGLVAHECILDLRPMKEGTDVTVDDAAKRLMDYGFHAPTVSWPIPGTMMVEPTESEPKAELDRFCEAMIMIRREALDVAEGKAHKTDNPLKNAPHTVAAVCADRWEHPYSRQTAAFPTAATRSAKFWPYVGRIDNVFGDRNFLIRTKEPGQSCG